MSTMTPEARQERHDRRIQSIEGTIELLPEHARAFVRAWRRPVELSGRAGPDGCAENLLREFVADVQTLLDAQWEVYRRNCPEGRTAGTAHTGSGV
jgi:hypothetical protein